MTKSTLSGVLPASMSVIFVLAHVRHIMSLSALRLTLFMGQYGIKVYDLIRFKLNLIHNRLTMQ